MSAPTFEEHEDLDPCWLIDRQGVAHRELSIGGATVTLIAPAALEHLPDLAALDTALRTVGDPPIKVPQTYEEHEDLHHDWGIDRDGVGHRHIPFPTMTMTISAPNARERIPELQRLDALIARVPTRSAWWHLNGGGMRELGNTLISLAADNQASWQVSIRPLVFWED